MAKRCFERNIAFEAYEIIRSDNGFWGRIENAGSFPIGVMSSPKRIDRLRRVTILQLPGGVWTDQGSLHSASWLVRMNFAGSEEKHGVVHTATDDLEETRSVAGRGFVSCSRDLQGPLLEGDASMKDRIVGLAAKGAIAKHHQRKWSADHYQLITLIIRFASGSQLVLPTWLCG